MKKRALSLVLLALTVVVLLVVFAVRNLPYFEPFVSAFAWVDAFLAHQINGVVWVGILLADGAGLVLLGLAQNHAIEKEETIKGVGVQKIAALLVMLAPALLFVGEWLGFYLK